MGNIQSYLTLAGIKFYFSYHYCMSVCVEGIIGVCRCAHSRMPEGGQRTIFKSQFSPMFMRVQRMELGPSGLGHGAFTYRATELWLK